MKIYVCLTYYHTLITMIKALDLKEKPDLILFGIPQEELLKKKLEKTGLFSDIFLGTGLEILQNYKFNGRIDKLLNQKKKITSLVHKYFSFDFSKYSEIYLYNDNSPLGWYIIANNIKYHLIEDALDFFKYYDSYYHVDRNRYEKFSIKYIATKFFGFPVWGYSPLALDIEINDKEGIKIPTTKVKVVSRKNMFNLLSDNAKVLIYNTFASGSDYLQNVVRSNKSAIIFTQPLFKDLFVKSMDDQVKVFVNIIREWQDKGYYVIVKPHPRDEADYYDLSEILGFSCIDKNIPSEILNFNSNAHFDVAIALTTTAINFLNFVDEKVFLGMEYVDIVLDR